VIDLETMSLVTHKYLWDCTEGEYIFWRCLEEVLAMPREELVKASLVMIREPGKARSVTKARATLKVVLDLVNGICSYPLKVGIESSNSGMGKANHGWNFFRHFYGAWKDKVFDPISRSRSYTDETGSSVETTTFKDIFVSFTDYEEATDNMHHDVARIVGEMWMTKCGIPSVLRGIVHATCFNTRTILFNGSGPLKNIGDETADPGVRSIKMERGVLMGDPLTKVILHLVNIGVRELTRIGSDESALDPFPTLLGVKHRVGRVLKGK
jgi:hypothetical protein